MPRFRLHLVSIAAAAAALTANMTFADTGIMTAKTKLGTVLTDAKGMTLYTYTKDKTGMSACEGQCAANWPPMIAPAGAKPEDDYTIIKRSDSTMQWAYYGKPLYHWMNDKAPGDTTGEGIGGVWHVAKTQ